MDRANVVYDEHMGGGPDDDPDRTPPAPPAADDLELPISERLTTVPPPPSVEPQVNLAATREIHAFEVPSDARGDEETTEVPHLASLPVNITDSPGTTVSNRPTVRPAEAQAAESSEDVSDPFAEDWDKS